MSLWVLALIAASGIAVAALDLSGTTNAVCADAGTSGIDTEMATLDTVKQSKTNPVDWNKERTLRKAIDSVNTKYLALAQKAKEDIAATGKVADATRTDGLACADSFKAANEKYAEFWDKNNGKTRAKLARQAGEARIANATMTFNEISSENVDAYNAKLAELADARKAYLAEAKTDVSDADRADIKSSLTPRLQNMASQVTALTSKVGDLLSQIKDQVTGGGLSVGGLTSCAKSAATSDNPATALLSPVTGLLDMVKSLGSNISDMLSEISDL